MLRPPYMDSAEFAIYLAVCQHHLQEVRMLRRSPRWLKIDVDVVSSGYALRNGECRWKPTKRRRAESKAWRTDCAVHRTRGSTRTLQRHQIRPALVYF